MTKKGNANALKLVELHINAVMNILNTFLDVDQDFVLIIHDPIGKYKDQFPTDAYKGDNISIHFKGWTFEQTELEADGAYIITDVVYGEDRIYSVTLEAIDVVIIMVEHFDLPVYARFFSVLQIAGMASHSEPQDDVMTEKAKTFEKTNATEIQKSMSSMRLVKPGEK